MRSLPRSSVPAPAPEHALASVISSPDIPAATRSFSLALFHCPSDSSRFRVTKTHPQASTSRKGLPRHPRSFRNPSRSRERARSPRTASESAVYIARHRFRGLIRPRQRGARARRVEAFFFLLAHRCSFFHPPLARDAAAAIGQPAPPSGFARPLRARTHHRGARGGRGGASGCKRHSRQCNVSTTTAACRQHRGRKQHDRRCRRRPRRGPHDSPTAVAAAFPPPAALRHPAGLASLGSRRSDGNGSAREPTDGCGGRGPG